MSAHQLVVLLLQTLLYNQLFQPEFQQKSKLLLQHLLSIYFGMLHLFSFFHTISIFLSISPLHPILLLFSSKSPTTANFAPGVINISLPNPNGYRKCSPSTYKYPSRVNDRTAIELFATPNGAFR